MVMTGSSRGRAVFLILGASAVLAQVILLRKLLAVFSGNELTLAAVLSGWMVWTGLASLILGRLSDRTQKPAPLLAGVLILAAIALPLTTLAIARIKPWLGLQAGEIAGLPVVMLASFLITGPVCALLGFGFNLCCRLVEEERLAVGRVYLWEALGAGLAGAIFTFVLAGRTSAFAQVQLTSGLLALGAGLVLRGAALRAALPALAAAIALAGFFLPAGFSLDAVFRQLRWPEEKVLAETDSRYANLAVIERGAERTFYVDGFPAFTLPLPELSEYVAHLPLCMCPSPKKVLLIGGGLSDVAAEILKHPVQELDYVQIDPALTALEEEFSRRAEALESDPRVRIHHEDARSFLARSKERWDAVILNLPPPESAQLNRFYTVEFYQSVSARLTPDGVLGLSAGGGGNYLTDAQAGLLATIRNTLAAVFPQVVILPLETLYLVAGEPGAQVTDNPDRMVEVLRRRGVATRWVRDYYLDANLSRERLASVNLRIKSLSSLPLNRDLYPRGYLLGMALWAEQAGSSGRRLLQQFQGLPPSSLAWPALALLLIGAPLAWRRATSRRAAVVIAVLVLGFVGMAAEVAVMMAFQIIQGYVYQLLGLIVAAFMVGLAAGARAGEWQNSRQPAPSPQRLLWWLVLLLLAGQGVWVIIKVLSAGSPSGAATALWLSLALFLVAAISGALFTVAADVFLQGRGEVGYAAGWVNGADHLGAAAGAFLTGTLVIPVFGLAQAFRLCLLLPAAALLVAGIAAIRLRKET